MAYLHSERNCSSCRFVREIVFAIPFLLIVVSPCSQNFKAETPSQSGSSNYAATNFCSPWFRTFALGIMETCCRLNWSEVLNSLVNELWEIAPLLGRLHPIDDRVAAPATGLQGSGVGQSIWSRSRFNCLALSMIQLLPSS